MKKAWYLIKNVAMAIGITAIGSYMADTANSIMLTIVGIYLIVAGLLSISKTDIVVSLVIIGIGAGAIALSQTVLRDNKISYYISAAIIALIALKQLLKLFNSYGSKKWQKALMKILMFVYPLFIIAGTVYAVFFQNFARATGLFSAGCVLWIIHAVLVVLLNSIPSSRKSGGRRSGGGNSNGSVFDKMKSLANYYTGGFDSLPYGAMIRYSVSVNVNGNYINFTLSGRLSVGNGITSEVQANSVRGAMQSAIERRQNMILNEAIKEIEKMSVESDYSVNVEVGNFSA